MADKDLMQVTLNAYQIIEKRVMPSGNSGRIYIPVEWVGKRVKIVLLESAEEKPSAGRRSSEE